MTTSTPEPREEGFDRDLIDRLKGYDWRGVESTMFRLTKSQAERLVLALSAPPAPTNGGGSFTSSQRGWSDNEQAVWRVLWERLGCSSEEATTLTDAVFAALQPNPSQQGGAEERIARIIDPKGWETRDAQYRDIKGSTMHDKDRPLAFANADYYTRDSLTKANAILAALNTKGE